MWLKFTWLLSDIVILRWIEELVLSWNDVMYIICTRRIYEPSPSRKATSCCFTRKYDPLALFLRMAYICLWACWAYCSIISPNWTVSLSKNFVMMFGLFFSGPSFVFIFFHLLWQSFNFFSLKVYCALNNYFMIICNQFNFLACMTCYFYAC